VRRWATRSTVSGCEPGRAFAFDVSSLGLLVARWRYDVEPAAAESIQVTLRRVKAAAEREPVTGGA
jgi:hypothetical protein